MKKYSVLSIDGGGVRGIIPAVYLSKLEEQMDLDISSFDVVIGTSTGGMLAAWILYRNKPIDYAKTIVDRASDIFPGGTLVKALNMARGVLGQNPLHMPLGARYRNTGLKSIVSEYIDAHRPLDMPRTFFYTTALNTKYNNIELLPLNNQTHELNRGNPGVTDKVKPHKAVLATSAAPSYFPLYEGYADGGIGANDPTTLGWILAKKIAHHEQQEEIQIDVLSLGTGMPTLNRPKLQYWNFSEIVESILQAPHSVMEHTSESLVKASGGNFVRFNPPLKESINLDCTDTGVLSALLEYTNSISSKHINSNSTIITSILRKK
jgi:patatin-like phospholipase/acyl hydrolase